MPIRKAEIPMETSQEKMLHESKEGEHCNKVNNGIFEETKKMEKFAC